MYASHLHRWKKGSGGADASAGDTLWTHLLAWNQRWQGHEEELRYKPSGNPSDAYVAGEGTSFIMAVAIGQVWLPNDTKLRRLVQLTVTAEQRRQAEQYLDGWEARPWSIQYIPVREGEFDIVNITCRLRRALRKTTAVPIGQPSARRLTRDYI